ncbi:MAG TPA: hypothetical protein PKE07_09375 [Lacibacter sp.]|nr:hypothetical protein [Lacibacter sp.]HMO89407.1 hypothetical protein [Lacibacter sp.]
MKHIVFLALLAGSQSLNAQFTKGTRVAGLTLGSAGFTVVNSNFNSRQTGARTSAAEREFQFQVTPSLGWFLTEQLLAGVQVQGDFTSQQYEGGNNVSRNSRSFTAGAGGFARYYFSGSGLLPYAAAHLQLGMGSGRSDWDEIYTAYSEKGQGKQTAIREITTGFSLGVTKMVTPQAGLDLALGYRFAYTTYRYYSESTVRYVNPPATELVVRDYAYQGFTNGVTLSLGFLFLLEPSKKKE